MIDWENWEKNIGIIASLAGSAVYAFHRPQKRLGMTILNFFIGATVSAVLTPAANELLRIQSQAFRAVIAFAIGFLSMILLPAIIDRIEKRKNSIADAVIDRAGGIAGIKLDGEKESEDK